jgi:hypothetical protein
MDRDTIIRLPRKAGFDVNFDIWAASVDGVHINKELHRFAALVAAAEREACAKLCENLAKDRGMFHPEDELLKKGVLCGAAACAAAIRVLRKRA